MRSSWLTLAVAFGAGIAVGLLGPLALKHLSPGPVPSARTPGANGPWGRIEALRFPFADSEELFPDRAIRLQPPRWFFERFSPAQVDNLFGAGDLGPEDKAELLDRSHWQLGTNGCLVSPSPELVRRLSPAARGRIYSVLAHSTVNYAQQFPFRFPLGDFDSRFAGSGLSEQRLDLLEGLTYTNAGALCFADLELLPALLATNEFHQAVECLYRLPAYRLRLRVYPGSDINALVDYWGKGREKKIRPLLESLTRVPATNGVSMAIGYLLPPFARLRLNTFPSAWADMQTDKEDCFWTAMNFFNEQPDMRYLDPGYVRTALQAEYSVVKGHPTYGDLVVLFDNSGSAIHSCVYLAEDFVYTKNGRNKLTPWVLMKISDMLLLFPSDHPYRMLYLRKNVTAPRREGERPREPQ